MTLSLKKNPTKKPVAFSLDGDEEISETLSIEAIKKKQVCVIFKIGFLYS